MENKRVIKLRQALADRKLRAMLVVSPINRRYLSGFTGSAGYVLITENDSYLLTDFRYMTQAPEQAKGFKVVEHASNVMDTVKEILDGQQIREVGFEQDNVTFGTYQSYKERLAPIDMVPVSGIVEQIRMFKDDEELAVMQRAADLADATFEHILGFIKPGVTERELDLEMEFFMRKQGATSSSFDTIVASGERSAMPHGVASSKKVQANELITFDFGALLDGYCSDLTRTVATGNPVPQLREIYDIVLEAQLHTLEHIKPGMTGREADALARDIITRHGYGEQFGHSTGHGLGMEVHESPRLSKLSDDILKPGMVVTVEPGIYLPGLGGVRIEDDIVITESGITVLTHSSKQFTVV
ncbi:Xaa-Pro peptidase family protein [Paenibacillus sp. JX-17]|uniref:Xaa-Pro peptidase family protein n=1 Tax=Paenibacillus lacisoli TaxID=3064525 RepID=A0ABT9C7D3_9BACL|nr:Xaa-Pro peptidase family protein [Paenibacillus sp. JX-17]MDO7905179.1 Xaa-Pro peptidase family protein [Paenibacillus sp. JX-17]